VLYFTNILFDLYNFVNRYKSKIPLIIIPFNVKYHKKINKKTLDSINNETIYIKIQKLEDIL